MQQNLPDFDSLWDYSHPAETEIRFRELLPKIPESEPAYLELLTQIARTNSLRQKFDEAHNILDQVEKRLDETHSRSRIRYLLERGRAFNSSGDHEQAQPLFEQALDIAQQLGEDIKDIEKPIGAITFSADESWLAYSDESKIVLWDVENMNTSGIAPLLTDLDSISGLSIIVEDDKIKYIISVNESNSTQIWDWESRTKLGNPMQDIRLIGLNPNEHIAYYIDQTGRLIQWQWGSDLSGLFCPLVKRNLTKKEWATYMVDREYESTYPPNPPGKQINKVTSFGNFHIFQSSLFFYTCSKFYSLGNPNWIIPSTTLTGYAGISTTAGICTTLPVRTSNSPP